MIVRKTLLRIFVIFTTVIATSVFMPNTSQSNISSTDYDFEEVEVGSSEKTIVSITNLGDTDTLITGIVFANTTCSDFAVVHTPDNLTIPAKGMLEVEIDFTPSVIGICSDTLRIYNGNPFPSMVTFVGTGVEPVTAKIDMSSTKMQSLKQISEIKSFVKESITNGTLEGTGKGKLTAQNRVKSLYKMLVIATHMIENSNIEAARNKLNTIYKKLDRNSNLEDFVTGSAINELAEQIQDLISSLNSI